jgi:hypothetical protein
MVRFDLCMCFYARHLSIYKGLCNEVQQRSSKAIRMQTDCDHFRNGVWILSERYEPGTSTCVRLQGWKHKPVNVRRNLADAYYPTGYKPS